VNILLWILQVGLALFAFMGGQYKLFHFNELAKMPQTAALPRGGWGALGIFEMLCAILLIIPAAAKWIPVLTPVAAAALALEALLLAVLFARYSLALTATNPLLYVLVMALVAAFVAYGRFTLRPLA
jgi:DoxX-like protein